MQRGKRQGSRSRRRASQSTSSWITIGGRPWLGRMHMWTLRNSSYSPWRANTTSPTTFGCRHHPGQRIERLRLSAPRDLNVWRSQMWGGCRRQKMRRGLRVIVRLRLRMPQENCMPSRRYLLPQHQELQRGWSRSATHRGLRGSNHRHHDLSQCSRDTSSLHYLRGLPTLNKWVTSIVKEIQLCHIRDRAKYLRKK